MKVVVTGSTGLIGSALVRNLRADNHEVRRLVRHTPRAADETHWHPSSGFLEPAVVDGVDAVVHLAGAGIGDHRWTDDYKQVIRESRVSGTTAVAQAIASSKQPPRVFVSASAVGYYCDTGDRQVDEDAPPGDTFLAGVCVDWEAAAEPARAAGVRVVHLRTGLVLTSSGGLLRRLATLVRAGAG